MPTETIPRRRLKSREPILWVLRRQRAARGRCPRNHARRRFLGQRRRRSPKHLDGFCRGSRLLQATATLIFIPEIHLPTLRTTAEREALHTIQVACWA